jgi:deazaflavin-dependent oxidoreductase (nitroreductase family)
LKALVNEPEFAYLTTVGRRTGLPRTVEMWFAEDGVTVYMLAGGGRRANWVRNLLADPHVLVRAGGPREWRADVPGTVTGRARLVEDPAEEARARRLVDGKYYGGQELTRWGRTALVVAIDRD